MRSRQRWTTSWWRFQERERGPVRPVETLAGATAATAYAVGDDEQSIFTWTVGQDPYVLVPLSVTTRSNGPSYSTKNWPLLRQILRRRGGCSRKTPAVRNSSSARSRIGVRGGRVRRSETRRQEAAVAARGHSGRPRGAGLDGRLRDSLRRHKVGEYSRDGSSEREFPAAGARPLAGRGRRHQVRDRRTGNRARSRRPPSRSRRSPGACCRSLLQKVEAGSEPGDFLTSVRALARRRPAQDPDTKKLWAAGVFIVKNLRALRGPHRALAPLVMRSCRRASAPTRRPRGTARQLTDPPTSPEAVTLAARLGAAGMLPGAGHRDRASGRSRDALRGMLLPAGVRHVPSSPTSTSLHQAFHTLPSHLFKALQLLHAKELRTPRSSATSRSIWKRRQGRRRLRGRRSRRGTSGRRGNRDRSTR